MRVAHQQLRSSTFHCVHSACVLSVRKGWEHDRRMHFMVIFLGCDSNVISAFESKLVNAYHTFVIDICFKCLHFSCFFGLVRALVLAFGAKIPKLYAVATVFYCHASHNSFHCNFDEKVSIRVIFELN